MMGYYVEISLPLGEPKTDSAEENLRLAKNFSIPFTDKISSDITVDAIFGTGFSGEADIPAIDEINSSGAYVISLDVPSGVNSDSGEVLGKAVKADLTVTFGYKKQGLTQYPAKELSGEVAVCPISVPGEGFDAFEVDGVAGFLPVSEPDDHKGSRGNVLLISGCVKYPGAAQLCTLGALKTGCGKVSLMLPKNLNEEIFNKPPEAILLPLDCEDSITFEAFSEYDVDSFDSIVIGPGLGNSDEVKKILDFLSDKNIPVIIDADGINSLCGNIDIIKKFKDAVITPHPGELAKLLGVSISEVQKNRIETARNAAAELSCTVVLKGASTVTATKNGLCFVNTTGNCGMATGGSGDVLAGIIGTLSARVGSEASAICGAYIHGLAGDICMEEMGSEGMLPSDVARKIPYAIQKIKN